MPKGWTTGYNNSLLSRADLAGVAAVSANWTTAYGYKQFKTIALSANRAAAAIGADVVADSATDTITLCAGPNIVLISDTTNDVITISGSAGGGGGGGGGSGDDNVNTAVRSSSGSWNSTNTTVKSNSGLLDVTAGTVAASKALVVDSSKDIATLRNVTASGQLIAGQLRVTTTTAPSSYTYSGTKGEIAYDTNYVYICVADNSWRRAPLAIW